MGEMKKITAEEARAITEQSNFLLKSAYRWISEAAKRNCNFIPLCKCDFDEDMFMNVIQTLESDGFSAEEEVDGGSWIIRW